MQKTESYISVHTKKPLKIVLQDTTDTEASENENPLVSQTKRFYSRQQYMRKLRAGVRLILASGRPNVFYETACRFILLRHDVQEFRQKYQNLGLKSSKPCANNLVPIVTTARSCASFAKRWREEKCQIQQPQSFINWEEIEISDHVRRQKKGREVQVVDPDLFLRLSCLCYGPNARNVYACYIKTKSMGARIDVRTMMGALLDPTSQRLIFQQSQESRILYYHLRISTIFLTAYRQVYIIMASALLRRMETGKHDFSTPDPDDLQAMRLLKYKRQKLCLGKIVEDCLKGAVERMYKKLHRVKAVPLEEEPNDQAEWAELTDFLSRCPSSTSNKSSTTATSVRSRKVK